MYDRVTQNWSDSKKDVTTAKKVTVNFKASSKS